MNQDTLTMKLFGQSPKLTLSAHDALYELCRSESYYQESFIKHCARFLVPTQRASLLGQFLAQEANDYRRCLQTSKPCIPISTRKDVSRR